MSGWVWALVAACAAAVFYGAGSVAEAKGAAVSVAPLALLRNGPYIIGLVCDFAGWLFSLVALRRLPLFVVQPVLTLSLVVTAVLAAAVLGSRLTRAAVLWGCALLAALAALVLCGAGESTTAIGPLLGAVLALCSLPVVAAVLLYRDRGATVMAVVAGLGFSGSAICARALSPDLGTLLTQPVTYALVVYGAAGAYGYAVALAKGNVTLVTATLWSVEVIVPTAVGIALLGDGVRAGWGPVLGVAVAGVLVATTMLARTDAAVPAG